jgi:predicted nucleic-acid-binding protein
MRALAQDDPEQARAASVLLEQAELMAIPLPVLYELVWMQRRVHGFTRADCMGAIEALMVVGQAISKWRRTNLC